MNLKDKLKYISHIETLRREVSKINIESYLVGGFVCLFLTLITFKLKLK